MKKYIIAQDKQGKFIVFATISDLRDELDNIKSWLSIRADSIEEAIDRFPEIEAKYDKINKADSLKHIIDLS